MVIIGALACSGSSFDAGSPPPPGTPRLDLKVASTRNPSSVPEGGSVTFTVTVTNLGPVDATNVTAGDSLSAGLTYVSASGSNSTSYSPTSKLWTIGALPVSGVRTLDITATANAGTANSWRTNRAVVWASEYDSVSANNTVVDSVLVSGSTPPPPVGQGEPVDPGSGYLWSDNFDRYTSVISMMSTGGCPAGSDGYGLPDAQAVYGRRTAHAAGSVTQACNEEINAGGQVRYQLITGRNGSGKALRGAIATTTTSQGVDWLTPWGTSSTLAHDVTKSLVMQYYFRVSPGGLPGSVGMKWFELWVNELGGRPVQRLQWSTNGGATTQWRVTDGPNTMSGAGRALQSIPPRLSTVNDGNWHRVTYLFKANTTTTYSHVSGSTSATEVYSGTSSRDGRIAMWVDGIKIIDIQQSLVNVPVPGGGGAVWCYQSDVDWIPHVKGEYMMWPSTINSPMPNPPWTLDHDDLKVWQF
jgi:uncharacterized repeat protein (TIGR01451 family)